MRVELLGCKSASKYYKRKKSLSKVSKVYSVLFFNQLGNNDYIYLRHDILL